MEFGLTLFPDVSPAEKSPADYFRDSLELVEAAEAHGYAHVRAIEHYFTPYGGYSPSSIVMLTAAAARTQRIKVITGAVIPAFNHPLKIAGELGMLDAISNGRLEVGFGRAFLPHEFERFGISRDESIARFREGIEQVDRLLREENVAADGQFHSFKATTSLPRPTSRPRPPFYVAANITAESYEYAGRNGHYIMAVPMAASRLREMLEIYRKAYRDAGHPGKGRVFLAFHMFVDRDPERARRIAKPHVESYFTSLIEATKEITENSSVDYKNYDKHREQMNALTMEKLIEGCGAWIGSPEQVCKQIERFQAESGGFEIASLQANFHTLPHAEAVRSIELFSREVAPHFTSQPVLA